MTKRTPDKREAPRDRSVTLRNPERRPRAKEPPLTLHPLDLETALGAALKAGPYRPGKKKEGE